MKLFDNIYQHIYKNSFHIEYVYLNYNIPNILVFCIIYHILLLSKLQYSLKLTKLI